MDTASMPPAGVVDVTKRGFPTLPRDLEQPAFQRRRTQQRQMRRLDSPAKAKAKKRHLGKAVVAGGISGGIEILITYPTDYVKTQMQLYDKVARAGAIECAKNTVKNHGFFGLYRAMPCLLFFTIPRVSTRFWAYETAKNRLQDQNGELSTLNTLASGLFAGCCEAVAVVTPMDTLKVKLVHDQITRTHHERRYRGLFHGVYTIVRTEGLRAIYRGVGPTVMKQGSNQAIRWMIYNRIKRILVGPKGDPLNLSVPLTMSAGATAGAISVYGNTPIDVVKTRMQGLQAHKYKNAFDCALQLFRREGVLGFYKGVIPRLVRVSLDVAIVMVCYEQIMKRLDVVWKTDD